MFTNQHFSEFGSIFFIVLNLPTKSDTKFQTCLIVDSQAFPLSTFVFPFSFLLLSCFFGRGGRFTLMPPS